ncbi:anti-sigma factor [Halopseudomonas sp.]|uniref:anti-sigma factor family protein n=1 Tax=Halopseudomonas sp. TaxID=2901191 RepID=UPI003562C397
MLSCHQMSELGSDIIDQNLTFNSRMAVMMHISMCRHCRRYIKQLSLTSAVLTQLPMPAQPEDIASVVAALKQEGRYF